MTNEERAGDHDRADHLPPAGEVFEHLEERQEIPLRPRGVFGARGIGRCVEVGASLVQDQPDDHAEDEQGEGQVPEHLLGPVRGGRLALGVAGGVRSVSTEQGHVDRQAEHEQRRQEPDVQGVESGQRLVAEIAAADHDLLEVRADHRGSAHDVGHDLGRPVALLVPGEQVAGVAESDRDEQQRQAEPPVELAGRR